MKLIIDEREKSLYERCKSIMETSTKMLCVQISKSTLVLGDIMITTDEDKPVILVERKTFADLFASIKDGRYEEQSHRLLHASEFPPHSIFYVLEGMMSQLRHSGEKSIVHSAATSLSFFKGFSIHRTATIHETAEWLIHMADKIDREFGKGTLPYYLRTQDSNPEPYCSVIKKVKKENVTPENMGEIILCQIPGISSATAVAVMKLFQGNIQQMLQTIQTDPTCLENIVMESGRKINRSTAENIKKYLCG